MDRKGAWQDYQDNEDGDWYDFAIASGLMNRGKTWMEMISYWNPMKNIRMKRKISGKCWKIREIKESET